MTADSKNAEARVFQVCFIIGPSILNPKPHGRMVRVISFLYHIGKVPQNHEQIMNKHPFFQKSSPLISTGGKKLAAFPI